MPPEPETGSAAPRLLPGEDPDDLIARARAEHRPIATFCLFSGGGDSAVLAHRCRDEYDVLVSEAAGKNGRNIQASRRSLSELTEDQA